MTAPPLAALQRIGPRIVKNLCAAGPARRGRARSQRRSFLFSAYSSLLISPLA
jgi:hypothetical protein